MKGLLRYIRLLSFSVEGREEFEDRSKSVTESIYMNKEVEQEIYNGHTTEIRSENELCSGIGSIQKGKER